MEFDLYDLNHHLKYNKLLHYILDCEINVYINMQTN